MKIIRRFLFGHVLLTDKCFRDSTVEYGFVWIQYLHCFAFFEREMVVSKNGKLLHSVLRIPNNWHDIADQQYN